MSFIGYQWVKLTIKKFEFFEVYVSVNKNPLLYAEAILLNEFAEYTNARLAENESLL